MATGGEESNKGEAAPRPPAEPFWAVHPVTGEPCIALLEQPKISAESPLAQGWELRIAQMLADVRVRDVAARYCTGTGPVRDPSGAARAFVRSIPIPAPEPEIAPGIAVTGLPAYLVIANQDEFTIAEALEGFGPMQVTLQPVAFDVAWGDGHRERIEDGRTGISWEQSLTEPAGAISHIYTERDPDAAVTVEAEWVATWSVGGFSGVVSGLATDSSFALPVREYRAVRLAP